MIAVAVARARSWTARRRSWRAVLDGITQAQAALAAMGRAARRTRP